MTGTIVAIAAVVAVVGLLCSYALLRMARREDEWERTWRESWWRDDDDG